MESRRVVWLHFFRTDLSSGDQAELQRLLSPAELERAGRFQFEADRTRFVAARGTLRQILARYLDASAIDVPLVAGIHGKPAIRRTASGGLFFNLSRARDLCVVAVSPGEEVGVDVEAVRPVDDALSIAKSRFTPAEAATIDSDQSFFALWTRKEAVVKCLGWGLSLPFDVFEVPVPTSAGPARVVVDYQGEKSVHWIQPVPLEEPGFIASIATAGEEPLSLTSESD